jgi:hypothetical protein
MLGKTRTLSWGILAALAIFVGIFVTSNAEAQKSTGIPLKARFISGDGLGVTDPILGPVLNQFENDKPGVYYENTGTNLIELGSSIVVRIVTDRTSSRYVKISFDSSVAGPGNQIPSGCAKPYFIYPVVKPVLTKKLYMKTGGEWEKVIDPGYPDYPTLRPTSSGNLDIAGMTEGQETYIYVTFFYFNPQDDTSTKRIDESRVDYWFADCLWAKIKASDWDGEKVNTWTLQPVTEAFKHLAWDGSGNWCLHPEGAIPYMLYSNSSLSCDHGTYRMPWQLEVTRR